jgi:prolyl oligopeptidase
MKPPPTVVAPREPITTAYHGVEVTDDYLWLEDATDDRTKTWTAQQDARTRAYLEATPYREQIRQRVEQILKAESTMYERLRHGGSTYFALKAQPPRQQPFLVMFKALDDVTDEQVLLDPNVLDESGATTIDWYVPSPDGSLVAASLSQHGTEDGTLHVLDAATGESVDVTISRVNSGTAGGSLAWRRDCQGFWYTRHPEAGTVPEADLGFHQTVWSHELGAAPNADRRELSDDLVADARIAEHVLAASADGGWVMDRVQKGDGGEWQVFVRPQQDGGEWRLVADVDDRCIDAVVGTDVVYLLSVKNAPTGKVLRLGLTDRGAEPVEVIPPGPATVEAIGVTDGRLWAVEMDGGLSFLRSFDHAGELLAPVDLPPICSVDALVRLHRAEAAWAVESFESPRSWWVHEDNEDAPRRTALDTVTPVDFTGVEVERVFATSRDGTRVPISLIARSDRPESGSAPTILFGYGGYGISMKPWFEPAILLWLEQGGVFAVANIRGGGEYGRDWHEAGRLAAKQNCFDDFIACADHLVETGIASRDRLAIMGGSNGGLLMGAVLTQRPDVAAAVLCAVPVLDSLRSETTPNGEFNVTEFGTVADERMFHTLLRYSPYHNVLDGSAYPPVLFTAGEFDPRVDAWHAKKMTARLQAATSSEQPVLLRMTAGGHGVGEPLGQLIDLWTDYYSFFFDRLGLDYASDKQP